MELFLKKLVVALPIIAGVLLGGWHGALADNIRPAYLDIEEATPGTFDIVWKVPRFQKVPDRFVPVFPESFKASSRIQRVKTSDAVIRKWTMVSGGDPLAGATIGVEGLEETAMDALVRIQLADGNLHRLVLRPTENAAVVPGATSTGSTNTEGFFSVLFFSDRWRYGLLFVAACLLSLTPAARRRGIVLCAAALVAGSVTGHALGKVPVTDQFSPTPSLTETDARRVVHGLMLNTYRAFILEKDTDIYDVLARSVAGEYLHEVYLRNKESLRIGAAEDTVGIVDRLDIKSIESMEMQEDGAISMVAQWDVYGSVRHQNHIHFRCNTYKAELTIVPVDGFWKLTKVELLEEERVI